MPASDLTQFRARIYDSYRATTAANPFAGPTVPLAGKLEQYRRRRSRYLPKSKESAILDLGCGSGKFLLARVRYADLTHELSFTPESVRQLLAAVGLRPVAMRQHGPLVHGLVSGVRWVAWQGVRLATWVALTAREADYGDRVYTHDLMFVAEKT